MAVETHIYDGSVFRKADEAHFYTGSAYQELDEMYQWDGSAWRLVFTRAIVTLTNFGFIQDQSISRPTKAGFRINLDGTIDTLKYTTYAQWSSGTDWIIPNGDASTDYQFKVLQTGGTSTWDVEAEVDDTWIAMGVGGLEWNVQDNDPTPAGGNSVVFTLSVRKGTGSVIDTCTGTANAGYNYEP